MNFAVTMTAAFLLSACPALAQEKSDPALTRLVGSWVGQGQMLGEEANYKAEAEMVLDGSFLLLSLTDASEPPQYDSRIFIGRSKERGDYVAHWLDTTGADGARVVGFGDGNEDHLTLTFHYEGSDFRDTFEFQTDGSFKLVVDRQGDDGRWQAFARYVFTPSASASK